MKTRTTTLALVLVLLAAGCAKAPQLNWEPTAHAPLGYRLGTDVVEFRFYPDRYAQVTRDASGEWTDIAEMNIASVTLAGEFNEWSREASPLEDSGNGWWKLSIPRADLEGQGTIQFKFVVNEWYWVEPPKGTINRVPTGFDNRSWNLALILP